jgi:hypothetical protein
VASGGDSRPLAADVGGRIPGPPAVRANRPSLRAEVEATFAAVVRLETFLDRDKGYGRIEARDKVCETCWTICRGNEIVVPSYGFPDPTVYSQQELLTLTVLGKPGKRTGSIHMVVNKHV